MVDGGAGSMVAGGAGGMVVDGCYNEALTCPEGDTTRHECPEGDTTRHNCVSKSNE